MLVAVMLPSLFCVPCTRMWLPTVTALAVAACPPAVYVVLAVVCTVTLVPSGVVARIVFPLTLVTVSGGNSPRPPGCPCPDPCPGPCPGPCPAPCPGPCPAPCPRAPGVPDGPIPCCPPGPCAPPG